MTGLWSSLFVLGTLLAEVWSTPGHSRLMRKLLSKYDRRVRPVKDSQQTINVSLRITLYQIIELDEKNQYLVTNTWLRFIWRDEFLVWNETENNGIKRLHIPSPMIWRPDIALYNSLDEERTAVELLSDTNTEISSNGTVVWTTPALLRSACKIRVDNYPFDEQRCDLKFGSWTYNGFEVNISSYMNTVMMDNFITSGEWIVVQTPCVRNEVYYSCCVEPYPDVTCTIVMKRRPLFYLYNLLFPCFLLICIGAMVYCLPVESGEKVSLAMTVMLAMTVFMLVIMENIPPTSEVVPILQQFIGATICLLTMSVLASIWVLHYHFKGDNYYRPSSCMRVFFLDCLGPILFLGHCPWTKRRAFYQRNRKGGHDMDLSVVGKRLATNRITTDEDTMSSTAAASKVPPGGDSRNNNGEVVEVLRDILIQLKDIANKDSKTSETDDYDNALAQLEWQSVARTLDRLFLIIFIILVFAMTLTIFINVP